MNDYYLGIDGGGTKTRATILDSSGQIVGIGIGESSNIGNIGKEKAMNHIDDAVSLAASQSGIASYSFTAAFLGLAGVVSDDDKKNVFNIAKKLNLAPDDMLGIDHDCRVALAGGMAGESGIVQIIGTGTSCFGINQNGKRWLAGGWGYLLSDEGGGYWLGLQAIKAGAEYDDERGESTILKDMILQELQINTMREVMHHLYTQNLSVSEIAELSHILIYAAQQNDAVAKNIIQRGMSEVARCVVTVATQLEFKEDDTNLVIVGGMIQAGDIITNPLKAEIHRHLPHCKIHKPQFDAAIGAALLARQHHAGEISQEFIDNLKKSVPESI